MKKNLRPTVHSPQPVTTSGLQSPSVCLPSHEGRGARGVGLSRMLPIIVFILTIAAFTAAFFPHSETLSSPSLLDIVQRFNIDEPTAELMATLRIPAPQDPSAFVLTLAESLGFREPLISTLHGSTRLNASSPHEHTLSIRLHPATTVWRPQVELQISLVSVHPGILAATERQLRDLIGQLRPGEKIPVFTTLSGTLPPERLDESPNKFVSEVFASLDGGILEGLSEGKLESWSGFTTRLPDTTKVGRNKLNLQVAIRYAADKKTVIIKVGTPLITGTY